MHDDVVEVQSGLWIYRYEAARADATDSKAGVIGNRACSREGVKPWTNVTYDEAKAACAAADMALCANQQWEDACEGGANCSWSLNGDACPTNDTGYPSNASPVNKSACNGHDLMASAGSADNDALAPTGSYGVCFSEVAGGEKVWDLSGNAKEWVSKGDDSADDQPIRGGSYNNLPGGLLCDSTFGAAPRKFGCPTSASAAAATKTRHSRDSGARVAPACANDPSGRVVAELADDHTQSLIRSVMRAIHASPVDRVAASNL